jgi:O-antigen ligase
MDRIIKSSNADAGYASGARAVPEPPRLRLARWLFAASMFALPAAAISTPWALRPAVLLGLLATLLAPDLPWAAWRRHRREAQPLLLLALLTLLLLALSQALHGLRLGDTGNRTRVLLLPICFIGVLAFRPPRVAFWAGAVAGLLGAAVVAVAQYAGGAPRAQGWSNPIVFADVALALLALAIFLRSPRSTLWVVSAAAMGILAIGLSGSRGVWLAGGVALPAGLWLAWKKMPRRGFAALLLVMALLAAALTPQASVRFGQFRQDLAHYAHGDVNSSTGARLELLALAARTAAAHPWMGIGVGRFGEAIRTAPDCAGAKVRRNERLCTLGHAHSDLPEWAATMGVPGLFCIVALYLLPLLLFLRALRSHPGLGRSRSAALAGAIAVLSFFACGLTQSIYAHQLTASCYAVLVGSLLGYARLEARPES